MTASPQPKVILFDIGGVCALSPLQSILDHELQLSIPPGWINYSIARSAPHGAWHNLERGTTPPDAAFFAAFHADLHRPENWKAFCEARNPPLLNQNQQQRQRQRQPPPLPTLDAEHLFTTMMTAVDAPDPWMFPALKNLRRTKRYIIGALSNTVLFPDGHPLLRNGGGFLGGPLRRQFDVFISSAHVGVRKPEEKMYALAVETLDAFARNNASTERGNKYGWAAGVRAEDILFLDDIGENLKAASRQGFRTVKVPLGRAYEAVEELERITGLALDGGHPKIAVKPRIPSRAKI